MKVEITFISLEKFDGIEKFKRAGEAAVNHLPAAITSCYYIPSWDQLPVVIVLRHSIVPRKHDSTGNAALANDRVLTDDDHRILGAKFPILFWQLWWHLEGPECFWVCWLLWFLGDRMYASVTGDNTPAMGERWSRFSTDCFGIFVHIFLFFFWVITFQADGQRT